MGVLARLALAFRENGKLLDRTQLESVTDLLTGLGNRRRLMTDLDVVLEDLSPERPWLLAIYDLDGFKPYNDTFGHPAGTRCSHAWARSSRRTEDDAYRLGGDEFCVLVPAGAAEAGRVLDASLEALTEHGEGFAVTSSFGAVLLPDEAVEGSDALRTADGRLYSQKRTRHSTRDRPHEMLLQALFVTAVRETVGTRSRATPHVRRPSPPPPLLSRAPGRRARLHRDQAEGRAHGRAPPLGWIWIIDEARGSAGSPSPSWHRPWPDRRHPDQPDPT